MSVLEMIREVNRTAKEATDAPALRIAVLVATLAAAAAALWEIEPQLWLSVATLAGIPLGTWWSWRHRHRDNLGAKALLAFGVMAAFIRFIWLLSTTRLSDIATLQLPLAELFLWVQILHAWDLPTRRDLMFSLGASLVLMATAAVLSITMVFAAFAAVWSVATVVALVLADRCEIDELPRLDPVTAGTLGRSDAAAPDATDSTDAPSPAPRRRRSGLVATVAAVAAAALVVAGSVFAVLPRTAGVKAMSFPAGLPNGGGSPISGNLSNPSLANGGDDSRTTPNAEGNADDNAGGASFGYFGFATSLDTAARGRPDDTRVMKVRAAKPALWRGQSFDTWDGRRWSVDPARDKPKSLFGSRPLRVPPELFDSSVLNVSEELIQTFYLEQPGPNMIFGAYAPSDLYFPDNRIFILADGSLRSGVSLDAGAVYTVVSRRPPATTNILNSVRPPDARTIAREDLGRYLQLPPTVTDRTRELARTLGAQAGTGTGSAYRYVTAATDWIAAHTRYSLNAPVPPRGTDAVDRFLFDDRLGFCEQIGTSLVVLARLHGLPARLAVGYAPGERNPFTGLFEVKASDAHAWAEIWFPGIGWQSFDPTAKVPLAGERVDDRAASGMNTWIGKRVARIPPWLVIAVGGVIAAAATLFAGRALWRVWRRRTWLRRRAGPDLGGDIWAAHMNRRLERLGTRCGRPRHPDETLSDYADALRPLLEPDAPERLATVVATVSAASFGRGVSAARRAEAEAAIAQLDRRRNVLVGAGHH